MAQRRMFSKKITETDSFLDMPMSSQCLYFHLNMSADDDGFIGNAKTIKRMIGAGDDDLKILLSKEFLIPFENGVVVIKDWKIHNYIRSDRYNETVYQDEKSQLKQLDNGKYEVGMTSGIPNVIPDVDQMDTQVRLGKVRLGEDRQEESEYPAAAQTYYENNIGFLKENVVEDLKFYSDKFDETNEIIIEAIDICIARSKKSWGYAKSIVQEWKSEELKTLKAVREYEKEKKSKISGYKNNNSAKPENDPMAEYRKRLENR